MFYHFIYKKAIEFEKLQNIRSKYMKINCWKYFYKCNNDYNIKQKTRILSKILL